MGGFVNEPRVTESPKPLVVGRVAFPPAAPPAPPAPQRHACTDCDYTGPSKPALSQHRQRHHRQTAEPKLVGEVVTIGAVLVPIDIRVSNGEHARLIRVYNMTVIEAAKIVEEALRSRGRG